MAIMVHAHCILDTYSYKHLEYLILIVFPLQKLLYKSTLMLSYMYRACFVLY